MCKCCILQDRVCMCLFHQNRIQDNRTSKQQLLNYKIDKGWCRLCMFHLKKQNTQSCNRCKNWCYYMPNSLRYMLYSLHRLCKIQERISSKELNLGSQDNWCCILSKLKQQKLKFHSGNIPFRTEYNTKSYNILNKNLKIHNFYNYCYSDNTNYDITNRYLESCKLGNLGLRFSKWLLYLLTHKNLLVEKYKKQNLCKQSNQTMLNDMLSKFYSHLNNNFEYTFSKLYLLSTSHILLSNQSIANTALKSY